MGVAAVVGVGVPSAKRVAFAAGVTEEGSSIKSSRRRKNFPKPPKNMMKGTGHIHFHKKAPTASKHKGSGGGGAASNDRHDVVQRVKMMTGTLVIYKGRKAEFVRTK